MKLVYKTIEMRSEYLILDQLAETVDGINNEIYFTVVDTINVEMKTKVDDIINDIIDINFIPKYKNIL